MQTSVQGVAEEARRRAQHVAGDWVVPLARAGYAAKAAVYAVVGVLAVQTAVGAGGRTTDSRGAIATIASQPFGQVMLGLLSVGLFGYVAWRFAQSIFNAESEDDDLQGIGKRVFYAFSGVVHASLALFAVRMALGSASQSGGGRTALTAQVLQAPAGQWLVAGAGVVVIGVGVYQIYKAYTAKFMSSYRVSQMSQTERSIAKKAGQAGLGARGVVFGVIGGFFIQAAITLDPDQARGLDAALSTIAGQPFGPWLLGAVAIGLVAYAVQCGLKAWYRHFQT